MAARIIGLGTTAIMARVLLKEDVAAYRQTFLAYMTLSPLLSMGVRQGMYFFLPTETIRVRGRVMDGMTVLGLMGLLFAVFIACGGNELLAQRFSNPKVARMLLWMIPFAIITTPASITEAVLVARNKVNLASAFGVFRQFVIGIATVVPLIAWKTCEAPLIGGVIASVLMAFAAFRLIHQSTPAGSLAPSFAGIKELACFSIPLALATMVGALSKQLDKLIVSFMCAPDEFAEYSLGAIEIPLIGMVTGAVTSILLTDMRKAVADNNKDEALRLFRLTAEKTCLLIFPAMFFFLICSESFIVLLYTKEYVSSAIPFRWYLLILPIRTVMFGSLLTALGKSHFLFYRSVLTLIFNIIASIIFVYFMGPWGAVVATVLVVYLWAVPANLYLISREFNVRWWEILPLKRFGAVSLQLLPVTALAGILAYHCKNPLLNFGLVSLSFGVFLAFWWNKQLYDFYGLLRRLNGSGK